MKTSWTNSLPWLHSNWRHLGYIRHLHCQCKQYASGVQYWRSQDVGNRLCNIRYHWLQPFKSHPSYGLTLNQGVASKYNAELEKKISEHCLIKRAEGRSILERSNVAEDIYIVGLTRLNTKLTQYNMRYAEKKCRKIKSGRIPYSPEALTWIKRTQVNWSLLKYHAGKIPNRGNLKQSAQRCGIYNVLSIPPKVLYERLKIWSPIKGNTLTPVYKWPNIRKMTKQKSKY